MQDVPNECAQLNNTQQNSVDRATQLALAKLCKIDKIQDRLKGRNSGLEGGRKEANLLTDGTSCFFQKLGKHRMTAVLAVRQNFSEHQLLVIVREFIVEVDDLHFANTHIR